ncbi:CehA/McbA family metallohydrolase [Cyclobacterium sp. 1_MG-2023]|nr:CehA/McbA family metallohydrolase [Cyclobacterium sp. 1_MG-2023]
MTQIVLNPLPFRFKLTMHCFFMIVFSLLLENSYGQEIIISSGMHHLRFGEQQEWSDFPKKAAGDRLEIPFALENTDGNQTLQIRQQDVKHAWQVKINGHVLGKLDRDEKDKIIYLAIPSGILTLGNNRLQIDQMDTIPDDIWIGQITLINQPISEVLSDVSLNIEVYDKSSGNLLPARITVTNPEGALQTVGASSSKTLAVRPGIVYTGNGKASFGLPSGKFTIYSTRGIEYGVDSLQLEIKPGDQIHKKLYIKREVPTEGWISSDTHIHTFTHSGHGDASMQERAITIAGEGIELPIITDHNINIDLAPTAKEMQVNPYFTPVIGNEVTTHLGHFNIFPVAEEAPIPEIKAENWEALHRNMKKTVAQGVIILNHARDVHGGFRPFDQERHIGDAGINLEDWKVPANAMEVINSGAHQTDLMRLYKDWFGLLNRGYSITPIGSSDSHDVSRYLVGQARTYIQSQRDDPGKIDINEAIQNTREGKVMVNFGLMAEMIVDNKSGSGDLVPNTGEINVAVRVLGPSWLDADTVRLYANGIKIREAVISKEDESEPGVKWTGTWTLPKPAHDVFLVAIASGPGKALPFWQIAKPYQPDSPLWEPKVMGSSGAVWIDVDGDGTRTSAYDYAEKLWKDAAGKVERLIQNLKPYDEAVAIQAASILMEERLLGNLMKSDKPFQHASPTTKAGFHKFIEAWVLSAAGKP